MKNFVNRQDEQDGQDSQNKGRNSPIAILHRVNPVNSPISIFAFLAFFAAVSCLSSSAQIQQAWVAKYNNGITNGTHQAVKMVLDANGNIYVTGFSQNTNGNLGYATIEYAPNGNQVWAARYGSTNYPTAQPTGLALDHQSNTIVTGTAVTVKYDTNGNQLWALPYSGTGVATDSGNNVCVTGVASNYTTMKFNSGGTNLWTQTFTSLGPCGAQTINISASDNIYVCGYEFYTYMPFNHHVHGTAIKYNEAGTQLWKADTGFGALGYANVMDAKLDSRENFYFVFNYDGSAGTFLTSAYSSVGASMWSQYNPTGGIASEVRGIAVDIILDAIVTGADAYPNSTFGTYKIDTNGGYVWTNLYPSLPSLTNSGVAIALDASDNVYVTGFSTGTNSGEDIVTIKYDSNGNQIWLQRYNGPGNGDDEANVIAVDANGNVYVTGYETVAGGGTEMVTIKYAPGPSIQKQSNGNVLLQTAGSPGQGFDFQASTNLQDWQDLGTNTADSNGLVQFLDTNAPLFPCRFYLTNPH